ncbi:MAG: hypothetical protein LQ349_002823 [Xanthoria aureola]|nr:MAG: hypothetical protein LQ349_002823 [Xanthoria aureola]
MIRGKGDRADIQVKVIPHYTKSDREDLRDAGTGDLSQEWRTLPSQKAIFPVAIQSLVPSQQNEAPTKMGSNAGDGIHRWSCGLRLLSTWQTIRKKRRAEGKEQPISIFEPLSMATCSHPSQRSASPNTQITAVRQRFRSCPYPDIMFHTCLLHGGNMQHIVDAGTISPGHGPWHPASQADPKSLPLVLIWREDRVPL